MDDYDLSEVKESEESCLVAEEVVEEDETGYDSLLTRIFISALIVLFCWGLVKVQFEKTNWIRQQLHLAINASNSQTFGRLVDHQAVQKLIEQVKGLVRFEEINRRWREGSKLIEKDRPPVAPLVHGD